MAWLSLSSLQSERCGESGAVHLHLYPEAERGGGDEQLDGAEGDAAEDAWVAGRCDERPNDVCHSLPDGTSRFAFVQSRHRVDRFDLCRPEHADHDAYGKSGLGSFGGGGGVQPWNPLGSRLQSRAALHFPLSGRERDHFCRVRVRRQCFAREKVLGVAYRLVPRSG